MTRLQPVPHCSRVSVPIQPPPTSGSRYTHLTRLLIKYMKIAFPKIAFLQYFRMELMHVDKVGMHIYHTYMHVCMCIM